MNIKGFRVTQPATKISMIPFLNSFRKISQSLDGGWVFIEFIQFHLTIYYEWEGLCPCPCLVPFHIEFKRIKWTEIRMENLGFETRKLQTKDERISLKITSSIERNEKLLQIHMHIPICIHIDMYFRLFSVQRFKWLNRSIGGPIHWRWHSIVFWFLHSFEFWVLREFGFDNWHWTSCILESNNAPNCKFDPTPISFHWNSSSFFVYIYTYSLTIRMRFIAAWLGIGIGINAHHIPKYCFWMHFDWSSYRGNTCRKRFIQQLLSKNCNGSLSIAAVRLIVAKRN